MPSDYSRLIANTVERLPIKKQAEIYHFAQYVKSTSKKKNAPSIKKKSVFDLFGTVTSKVTDASINHDRYLYE